MIKSNGKRLFLNSYNTGLVSSIQMALMTLLYSGRALYLQELYHSVKRGWWGVKRSVLQIYRGWWSEEARGGGGGGQADQHAVFCRFLSSCCVGHGCHSTIRGSGSPPAECSIVSCLLNRQRGERGPPSIVAPLQNSKEDKKKKTSDDCIITH